MIMTTTTTKTIERGKQEVGVEEGGGRWRGVEEREGWWRSGLTQQQVEEPASLKFSDGHDGPDGLHETDDGQRGVREAGREHVLVQPHSVVPHLQCTTVTGHQSVT